MSLNFSNRRLSKAFSSKSFVLFLALGLMAVVSLTQYREIISLSTKSIHYIIKNLKYEVVTQFKKAKFDLFAITNPNPSNLDLISLDIAVADLRKIDVLVKKIGIDGNLQKNKKKWYPVNLRHNNETYSGRIRIRGDQSIHWINKKSPGG
jgi:uncharacterized protein YabE (DUF348 family)